MLLLVPTNAYALQEQIVTSVMKHAPVVGAAAAPPAAVAMLVLALVVSVLQPNLDFTLGLSGALPRLSRHGPSLQCPSKLALPPPPLAAHCNPWCSVVPAPVPVR